jgi:hypothetical protein
MLSHRKSGFDELELGLLLLLSRCVSQRLADCCEFNIHSKWTSHGTRNLRLSLLSFVSGVPNAQCGFLLMGRKRLRFQGKRSP